MAHPLYMTWWNMKRRCENPDNKDYEYYGAKGITVAPVWATFAGFLANLPPGHKFDLELDRRENHLGYSPKNCRWVTAQESRQNRGKFRNNTSGITGVGTGPKGFRARVGKGGATELYHGGDFFEACCARKSWEAKWVKRGAV